MSLASTTSADFSAASTFSAVAKSIPALQRYLAQGPRATFSVLPSGYDSHSHGESPINGGFDGKIIYKWVIFHGYVK